MREPTSLQSDSQEMHLPTRHLPVPHVDETQSVPAPKYLLAGHLDDVPVQTSAMSQGSLEARHEVS